MNITTQQKLVDHPLEDIFDIESGTTMVEYKEVLPAEVVSMPTYDAKDDEIEVKLEEIYTVAMGQVSVISDELERVEGKFKARMGEVTATMLNVALGAVREKSVLKMHKDKLTPIPGTATHTTNNNLIVADRNEILRALLDKTKR
jgi:hypothetical protein